MTSDIDPMEARRIGLLPDPDAARCDACDAPLQHGDWPFCPHGRGTYGFRMAFSMKTQGWTRRER